MTGQVDEFGTPIVHLEIAGRDWVAVIDTGFNGGLSLPIELADQLGGENMGQQQSVLADGTLTMDDVYAIDFPFDGEIIVAMAIYAPVEEILIGTELLRDYRLEIDFPAKAVDLTRVR